MWEKINEPLSFSLRNFRCVTEFIGMLGGIKWSSRHTNRYTIETTAPQKKNLLSGKLVQINKRLFFSFRFLSKINFGELIGTTTTTNITTTTVTMTHEGEVNLLLIVTVIIGTVLMSSLLACYICVFRQLCCSRESDLGHGYRHRGGKRASGPARFDSVNLNELTHISSQPTETERI